MSDVPTWTEEKLELLFAKSKSQNYFSPLVGVERTQKIPAPKYCDVLPKTPPSPEDLYLAGFYK